MSAQGRRDALRVGCAERRKGQPNDKRKENEMKWKKRREEKYKQCKLKNKTITHQQQSDAPPVPYGLKARRPFCHAKCSSGTLGGQEPSFDPREKEKRKRKNMKIGG